MGQIANVMTFSGNSTDVEHTKMLQARMIAATARADISPVVDVMIQSLQLRYPNIDVDMTSMFVIEALYAGVADAYNEHIPEGEQPILKEIYEEFKEAMDDL